MNHHSSFRGAVAFGVLATATLAIPMNPLAATLYKNTILTSSQSGVGVFTDTNLVNAWGIAEAKGGPFVDRQCRYGNIHKLSGHGTAGAAGGDDSKGQRNGPQPADGHRVQHIDGLRNHERFVFRAGDFSI